MMYKFSGNGFYVKGPDNMGLSIAIDVIWPWFMPVLFTLAGMSSAWALAKRTPAEYIRERFSKLFIPFVFGLLLIMPIIAYFTAVFNENYSGTFPAHCLVFFTRFSRDLSGYNGEFGIGHLWYILYLFIISLAALPVMVLYNRSTKKINGKGINLAVLLALFVIPFIGQCIPILPGKSIFEYLFFFIIGFMVLSQDCIIEKLKKHRFLLSGIFLMLMILNTVYLSIYYSNRNMITDHRVLIHFFVIFETEFYAYCGILALIGLSGTYLDVKNRYTDYFSKSSFGVYLFHLLWIVITAYFVLVRVHSILLQIVIVLAGSVILTLITYEIVRRIPIVKTVFCLK